MGRKGVSKRKPKKSGPSSKTNIGGSSTNAHSGGGSLVQSLVKDKGTPLNKGGMHPSAGSNKTQKKH